MPKGLQLNGIPFTKLRIVYFKAFDTKGEKIFLDATDEQILKHLSRTISENVVISHIDDVEVLEVIRHVPDKLKLDVNELKAGISHEERQKRDAKIDELRKQYPGK